MPETGEITTRIKNNIATIAFYHPKGNALPGKMLRNLAEAIRQMEEKPGARVLVLKSRGEGAFCGGASFEELMAIGDYEEGKRFFMGFANLLNAMRTCPKLIIVRVQGKTVGGGVGIAAAGDYVVAHQSASVKLSELALGIGPFVVGPAVERKIGTSAFSTLSVDAASWNSAGWAETKGLFSRVCATYDQLDDKVETLAGQLSKYSPEAMKELKTMLWEGTDDWELLLEERAEISGRLVLSDFTREFIKQFKNS
ncbi:methylglutaconyl-CoA hydratase [Fodinibius roseus]|uniref:Methylglutaconyl-CoA hydratase n=1 Tax=Fodinibius roseus TaxID=1194090 RepID=A0A1M5GDC4_9BACT|nr:enoyl-CoA hydratase/isomerase family protein [Fodinibius roseus]SHG01743.1 methylglutaconyl-CoA hydratase [Fodinibius roseus]